MIHDRQLFAFRPGTISQGSYRLPAAAGAGPLQILDEPRRDYALAEAYGYCERMAQMHYENVPVASRFLPQSMRPHVLAIYAFARAADDFADEARYAGRRHEALDLWEQELVRAFHGEADHPVFVALRDTIEKRELPITPFTDLLTAFRMDQTVTRYPTFADLRRYCAHGCEPLGRVVLYLFGYRDPALHGFADDMCSGLQMAHFLQDLGLDFDGSRGHGGRLYLPLEDLRHFGVTETDLRERAITPAFRDMMRFQIARARALLERGRPLLDRVGRDLAFELELTWHSGQAVLDKIEAVGYDVFRRRPILTSADRARLLVVSLSQRWPRFIGR